MTEIIIYSGIAFVLYQVWSIISATYRTPSGSRLSFKTGRR